MHRKDQSQTNNKGTGRDAAIQIISNPNAIEFLSPVAFSALCLAFFF